MFSTVPVNDAGVFIKITEREDRICVPCTSPAQAIETAAQLAHQLRNCSDVEDIQAVVVYRDVMVPIATYSRIPYTESNHPN